MANLCITFDDCCASVAKKGLSIFAEHNVSATFFVCGGLIRTVFECACKESCKCTVSIGQLKELHNKNWEIASHTYSHARLTNLSKKEIEQELEKNIKFLTENGFNANGFSHPWGVYNDNVIEIIKHYHKYARATMGTQPSRHEEKYRLRSQVLSARNKVDNVIKWLTDIINTDKTLILFGHRISDEINMYSWSGKDLITVIKYALTNDIKIKTMSEVYE